MKLLLFLVLLLPAQGFPQMKPNLPAPAANETPIRYLLVNLKTQGFSQYNLSETQSLRQYLHFKNAQGDHYIIYEEAANFPPLKDLIYLRQMLNNGDAVFSIEMECEAKAFCTGDCKNMYYEMSNTPNPTAKATSENNRCKIFSFAVEKAVVENRGLASEAVLAPAAPTSAAPSPAAPSPAASTTATSKGR